MKIRLTQDVPVEKKHGMTKGRVFETVEEGHDMATVRGDVGEPILLQWHEYEEVDGEPRT